MMCPLVQMLCHVANLNDITVVVQIMCPLVEMCHIANLNITVVVQFMCPLVQMCCNTRIANVNDITVVVQFMCPLVQMCMHGPCQYKTLYLAM